MTRVCLLAALMWLTATALAAAFPYETFPATTFAELMVDELGHEAGSAEFSAGKYPVTLVHPPLKARLVATYRGLHRPLSSVRLKQIAGFAKAFKISDDWVATFRDEYLFSAEGQEWWLPVQQQVATFIRKELPKGKTADLYAVYGGATKLNKNSKWLVLLVIEEFNVHQ